MDDSQAKFELWVSNHYVQHGWEAAGIRFMLTKKADGSYMFDEVQRQYRYWKLKDLFPTEYP